MQGNFAARPRRDAWGATANCSISSIRLAAIMDNLEQPVRSEVDGRVVDEDGRGGPAATADGAILSALAEGRIEEKGLLPYSSNYAFLATVHHHQHEIPAVYKPRRGENPLWDFPAGTLCQREDRRLYRQRSAGLASRAAHRPARRAARAGQHPVFSSSVIRTYTTSICARTPATPPALRRLTLFDYLINNADRKAGHCLYGHHRRFSVEGGWG